MPKSIALTAFTAEYDQQQAIGVAMPSGFIASGFQMHISKPVEPEVLAAAVAQLAKK